MTELYLGDARDLAREKIEPESVDLIFTDPPYPKEYLLLYDWLAKEAVRVLKPNGFLIAYVGPYWKNVVMGYFEKHLQYFYDFICKHVGNTSILWPRKIISGYKSIMCYHKKGVKPLPNTNVLGAYSGSGGDKRFHKWGQDEIMAQYYIECFSHKKNLVVDYFLGGGTTGEVCKRIDRNFIGFEIDSKSFKVAKGRIETGLLPDGEMEQLSIL